ncbi:hypothetical protein NQ318_010619 [Aromia moschata]|uniref:Uncharacterized protein n=1 Tax=Aromia moschata TaxID=1265417 RepID=A0AAV8XKC4_9CUCU|nr:hypothetical protein NQ318_010619 [Aromia moschata]
MEDLKIKMAEEIHKISPDVNEYGTYLSQTAFIDEGAIKTAINDVIKNHKSIRVSAADHGLKPSTLQQSKSIEKIIKMRIQRFQMNLGTKKKLRAETKSEYITLNIQTTTRICVAY